MTKMHTRPLRGLRHLPALLAAATLGGCGGSGVPDLMDTLDDEWESSPLLIESALLLADSDGLLTDTSDWIEGVGDAVAGHTVILPFDEDGTTLDEDALHDELDVIVGDLVDAMEVMAFSGSTASPVLQNQLPTSFHWDVLHYTLTEQAVAGMVDAITLDEFQPGDYLVEWDDCSKVQIGALGSMSVEIADVTATADTTGFEVVLALGSPEVTLDEVNLWHRRFYGECVPRTVEGVTVSLAGIEFDALTLHVDLARATASYDWPRLEVSASSWCGEEVEYSSTYHDILYGDGGEGLPGSYSYSYLDMGYTDSVERELGAAVDALTPSEKAALIWDTLSSIDSFWDQVETIAFVLGVLDEVIRIAIEETVESALDAVDDWLTDQFGSGSTPAAPGGNVSVDYEPDGDPLHGDHVALEIAVDVDPADASDFGLTLVTHTLDHDNDDVLDPVDNCPDDANPGQGDGDYDGVGDVCDAATLHPAIVSNGLDAWEAEQQFWARVRAIVVCGEARVDRGEMFDQAGFVRPDVLHVITETEALNCLEELEELLWRIKDRYDERWPGEEHVALAPTVDSWLAETALTPAQLDLVGAYIDAASAMAAMEIGDGSLAPQRLASVREQIAAHVQIQPGM
jgi:hypothetical protein